MKLRETLTKQQMIDLLSGNVVGIFPSMILSDDVFYGKLYELCLGYYTARSGEKTISITYERFISLVNETPEIDKTPEEFIGTLIRGKFLDKWNRVYDALITSQYDMLNNRESIEDKTGNNQNKDTHNTTKAKQGTNSDITTFDTNVEDNGKIGTHEIVSRDINDNNGVYGFNSIVSVGESTSNENTMETTIADAEKNTSHNVQAKTGTESKQFGIDESETHTGTDTTDITISEKLTKKGRDGSGAELIMEELNLRNTQIFFDIIYSDIDSIATLQIYI